VDWRTLDSGGGPGSHRNAGVAVRIGAPARLVYLAVRKAARVLGVDQRLRAIVGPVIGRLFLSIAPKSGGYFVINSHQMVLAENGRYPPIDMALDRFELGTSRLLSSLLRPGMVVIDIGAHVGYYSLLAAQHVGADGLVFAFEPEPANHALLLRNIELNGYRNIVPMRQAVADNKDRATLFLASLDNGRHSMYNHGLPQSGSVEIETTDLDSFLEEKGCSKVDLIKIDVEGAEPRVLKGMRGLMAGSDHLSMIIEFNPLLLENTGASSADFPGRLASYGFAVSHIDETKGPVPIDAAAGRLLAERLLNSGGSVNLLCVKSGSDSAA